MLKLSDATLLKMLTPERIARLGLQSNTVTDEELRAMLTNERMAKIGVRNVHERDDLHQDVPLIEFITEPRYIDVIPKPYPAFKQMPEWFKKAPTVMEGNGVTNRDHFGALAMGVKKCLPLLDGMSVGYIIPLFADMNVRLDKSTRRVELTSPAGLQVASTHDVHQLGSETGPTGKTPAMKFHNPWIIKTRPGWSTLFLPPLNRVEEDRFTCIAALVDTDADRYPKQVNFPAIWHKAPYDGLVEAGTPLVLAIPIRRLDLERYALTRVVTDKERDEVGRIERTQRSRRHYYTNELRDVFRGHKS